MDPINAPFLKRHVRRVGKKKPTTSRDFKMIAQIYGYEICDVMLDLGSDMNIFPNKSWETTRRPHSFMFLLCISFGRLFLSTRIYASIGTMGKGNISFSTKYIFTYVGISLTSLPRGPFTNNTSTHEI